MRNVCADGGASEAGGDRLDAYRARRNPRRTPEPFGDRSAGPGGRSFVIQRHAARRLHYDLRLERDGILESWAVPRGLPLEPGDRRLAVRTEDHPLAYAELEGEIPAGEYGAGTVEIWDRGTYELLEEKRDGGLTVRLHGARLRGVWALVPASPHGDPRNWLLIRKREQETPPIPLVVYEPMLATLAQTLPDGEGWAFEVKWDGFRALGIVRGGEVALTSRTGNDLTERFVTVARALPRALRSPDCVVDGEIVALDPEGRPSFAELQRGSPRLAYYLFDLLELDREPLLDRPWYERREKLEALLDPSDASIRLSPVFDDGEALLSAARAQRLEGVVAKRIDARYQPGKRSRDWLKVKTHERQEFVIAGYTRGEGRRADSLGALVLAVHEAGELRWVGNCGTGFTDAEIELLLSRLRPLARSSPPFRAVPRMPRVRLEDVVWVEPVLVCEVEFAEWTRDGRLRAPSYKGLREDKPADAIRRERPLESEYRVGRRSLRLVNLDKVFWPDEGITKGELLDYYRRIAPVLVPHLRDRPFTMKRYPNGVGGAHFFQKRAPAHMPAWIRTRELATTTRDGERTRLIRYPLVNDELALLWMVNMGCVDLNVWLSRVDHPDRPDAVLFDLDPSEGTPFEVTVEVAQLIRQLLDLLGLDSYPKTSGADGIHVLVPVTRRSTFADTREFASIVATTLCRTHPELVTTEWSRAKRRGVLIDVNQNREGATIASVYSVRPRPGAPVSTPLAWNEVVPSLDPRAFTMAAVLERVERSGDLFAPVLSRKQSLRKAIESLQSG